MRLALRFGLLAALASGGLLAACSSEDGDVAGSGGTLGSQGGGGQDAATGGAPPCSSDLDSDPEHCGACDRACAPGQTCEGGDCVCDPATVAPSFQDDVAPVLGTSCGGASCHGGPQPKVGLDLQTDPHTALVGVTSFECGAEMRLLVEPGHPERSYLMNKITGQGLCSGTRMPPPPSAALPDATIRAISDWICAGAAP